MKTTVLTWAIAGCVVVSFDARPVAAREFSLQDRVDAQTAIERVYWQHRIWPSENPQPKPEFSASMPEETIRAKVADALAGAAVLEAQWKRSIGREQIQAEMNRIAAESKDPAVLAELFEALHNDPELIAETLIRPLLSDRLLRSLYARDPIIHADARRLATRALAGVGSIDELRQAGGVWSETTVELETWDRSPADVRANEKTSDEIGALQESDDAFFVTARLSADSDRGRVGSMSWPKSSFDAWWREQRTRYTDTASTETTDGPFALPVITAAACVNDRWTVVSGFVAAPRYEHTAVWTGTEMIVWGGSEQYGQRHDGGRYTPATDSWKPLEIETAPQERHLHTAIWTGTEMIIWGGHGTFTAALSGGARYNPSSDTWSLMSSVQAPSARMFHSAVWTGTEMIIWGGSACYISCPPYYQTGGRYSPSTDTWVATETAGAPAARSGHVAVWTGSRMIVWGGGGPSVPVGSGGQYDPATNTWTATSTLDAPLGGTAVWAQSVMIVWGQRETGTENGTGGRYNPVSDTWTPTTLVGVPVARSGHSAVWTGSVMIVWGGINHNSQPLNNGGQYSPSTDSWIATPITGAPETRSRHSAIWTGSEMIVWGGKHISSAFGSGGRYNPATNTWTPTATNAPAPLPRSKEAAVWTGVEMVIWGGRMDGSPFTPLATGGRYNAALDSWSPTATSTAPQARHSHSIVWTGERALIWGGFTTSGSSNTGAGYRPSDDSWVTLSTTNAPEARTAHTAIWDGTEMVVWGGFGATYLNTGGRYRPASDTWTPTSTSLSPTARQNHSAVWDGRRMIVWGGQDQFTQCNGGRYDPVIDQWFSMATTSGPCLNHKAVWSGSEMLLSGRDAGGNLLLGTRYRPATNVWTPMSQSPLSVRTGQTVVWTGTNMLVWGGAATEQTGGLSDHGALYSPATNSWTPMSRIGAAPSRRREQSGVWTGSEMIIWGGETSAGTGARYCGCAGGAVQLWIRDADGDGFGNSSDPQYSCGTLAGYVTTGGDCDDGAPAVNPTATDAQCNGVDDNCNGTTDEGYVAQPTSCGAGACGSSGSLTCVSGQVQNTCVAGTPTTEVCNGIDDDCNGTVDNVALPAPIAGLSAAKVGGDSQWSWAALAVATSYDLTRGDLSSLRSLGGDFELATQSCVADDAGAPSATDSDVPAEGEGFWYSTRGVNCTGNGTYNDGSTSLFNSRDAGILNSGMGCP